MSFNNDAKQEILMLQLMHSEDKFEKNFKVSK